jgi:hypothetical protein
MRWHFTATSLTNIDGTTFFQMLPNIRGMDPNFETLREKSKLSQTLRA